MVKTLVVETDLASITVQELTGFDTEGRYLSHLQLSLTQHLAGVEELPTTPAQIDALINPAGWDAIRKYTKMIEQTRCIQWKGDVLFILPGKYAPYPMHCAAFDTVCNMPSDFLEAWWEGIERVNITERDIAATGKTPGE